jgi:AcrR family transcriptional regulator
MNPTDDTRSRLLDAAGEVFAAKGRDGATVRDILKHAGMKNIAAVNYYFDSKEALYDAVLRYAFQCGVQEVPQPQWSEGTKPELKLRMFIHGVAHHMLQERHPWHMQLLLRELSNPSEVGKGIVLDFIRPLYLVWWGILRELVGPDVPEDKLHLIGFSIVGQIFYHRVGRPVLALVVGPEEIRSYTPEKLAEHITAFSLAALGVRPSVQREVPS